MAVDRSRIVDENFLKTVEGFEGKVHAVRSLDARILDGFSIDGFTLLELFESQITSRHLDLQARALKASGDGFYTIGSSGHEGNVVLGRAVRADDPTFLHYRSAALMVERARQVPGSTPIFDHMLSLVAAREDPASGGRHKVFGSRSLWVPPQTSTIASHLPKAVGCAFAIDRARPMNQDVPVPADAIVVCTFGDASVNHAVAQTAFNAAAWTAFQHLPLPVLFVCEDNGLGISVRTPRNWVASSFKDRKEIRYFRVDGTFLPAAWEVAREAVAYCRDTRRPAFLHVDVVRLLGHAGSDAEIAYREKKEIVHTESRDPLLWTARLVLDRGLMAKDEVIALYEEIRTRVAAAATEAAARPRLESSQEIVAPLAPDSGDAVTREAGRAGDHAARVDAHGGAERLPERGTRKRHMAVQINRALVDLLAKYPEVLVFGEDVAGRKGGVYGVTADLTRRFGVHRVFNTLLDETTILGVAIGTAHLGLIPIPEIQYLAYLHNAEDQIRGEACSLSFFSNAQFQNPMVVRIASFGYQKGFGGHFHNDNSIAVLRDVPGLIIAAPSRGDDAARMLRTCVAAARLDGRVSAFLEPIALYMTRDLHASGDGLWETSYPGQDDTIALGEGCVHGASEGDDLTIVTYANGVWMSLRAARVLSEEHGIRARVVDLRWLAPLPEDLVEEQVRATGNVLVVDEGRRTGGVNEAVAALIAHRCGDAMPRFASVCGEDTYIPLGPAANAVLPSEERIVAAARALCGASQGVEGDAS